MPRICDIKVQHGKKSLSIEQQPQLVSAIDIPFRRGKSYVELHIQFWSARHLRCAKSTKLMFARTTHMVNGFVYFNFYCICACHSLVVDIIVVWLRFLVFVCGCQNHTIVSANQCETGNSIRFLLFFITKFLCIPTELSDTNFRSNYELDFAKRTDLKRRRNDFLLNVYLTCVCLHFALAETWWKLKL